MKHIAWAAVLILLAPVVLASTHGAYSEPRAGFSAASSVSVDDTAVYNTGYVSENGSNWTAITLTGEAQKSNWVIGTATSDADLTGIRYVAIYSCTWSSTWDCSETWQVKDRGQQNTKDSQAGDEEALQALYAAAGGSGWTDQNGWGVDMDLSQPIDRVTVETTNGEPRVVEIDLRGNGLTGSIDVPEIGNLKQMRLFSVTFNDLDTQIPQEIGHASNLEYLYLSQSDVMGRELFAHEYAANVGGGDIHPGKRKSGEGNVYRGGIPSQIGNLQKLKWLVLDWTDSAEGAEDGINYVPAELFSIKTLEGLHLYNNNNIEPFELPSAVCEMTNLDQLAIGVENSGRYTGPLTGLLPSCFGQLSNLRHLRFGENPTLTINLDSVDLSGLRSIRTLGIRGTRTSGDFPAYFVDGSLPNLTALITSWPRDGLGLEGAFPEVNPVMDMHVYQFRNNRLTSLPASAWTGNTKIIQPEFTNNQLTTLGTTDMTMQDRFRYFWVAGNELHEPWPMLDWDEIGSLSSAQFSNNRYVFKHMLYVPENAPNGETTIDLYEQLAGSDLDYSPQKPFGQSATRSVNTGNSITLDEFNTVVEHADNVYQWRKDASDISGATSRELTISDAQESDTGVYELVVTNPGAPDLTLTSEPVTVQVQDAGDYQDSVQGDYDALMDIYAATDGDSWSNDDGWGGDVSTMGSWYGVQTDADGRVTSIDLVENQLSNSDIVGQDSTDFNLLEVIDGREFPDSVGNLKRLEYFNVKGNRLAGPVPEGFMYLPNLEQLLLSGRIDQPIEYNYEMHPGKDHAYDDWRNAWTGPLPQDWSRLTSLRAVEAMNTRYDHMISGPLPKSLFDLPEIEFILFYGNEFEGQIPEIDNPQDSKIVFIALNGPKHDNDFDGGLTGPLPESWSELSAPHGKYLRFGGHSGINGTIPRSYADIDNIRAWESDQTGIVDEFPSFLFHERNPNIGYFFAHQHIVGGLPADLPVHGSNTGVNVLELAYRDIPGQIPEWVAEMGLIQFRLQENQFTTFHDLFYDPDAGVYRQLRNMYLWDNDMTGEFPDTLWASVAFEDTVAGMPSSDVVELQMDLGVQETGTISNTGSSWIRDESKSGEWSSGWSDYWVTVDDASGFEVRDNTNYETGYLYCRDRCDPSGWEGLGYTIRPSIDDRVIRFRLGDNRWIARKIVSVDWNNDRVTLDEPLDVDVSGLPFAIHSRESAVHYILVGGNNFEGPIPQSWNYIPTDRDVYFALGNNDFSGLVPDLSDAGQDTGGYTAEFDYSRNRFTFANIIPNLAANQDIPDHDYSPQKPFGQPDSRSYSAGSTIVLDDFESVVTHPDNDYQWERDGNPVSGATSRTLTIAGADSGDSGTYTLIVTNPGAPDLTLESEPVDITVS